MTGNFFDDAPAATSVPSGSGTKPNFFADPDDTGAPPGTKTGFGASAIAGPIESLTGLAGFGVKAAATLADPVGTIIRGLRPLVTGQPEPDPFSPSLITHIANKSLGRFNPENTISVTPGERIVRGLTSGLTAGLIAGPETTIGAIMGRTAIGGASGASAAGAEELAPESLKPAAGLVGGLLGGLGAAGVAHGAIALTDAAGRATAPLKAAVSAPAAEQQAAGIVANRATDLPAVAASVTPGAVEAVAGSEPTTFQQTGDMGLGALEREMATKHPELFRERQATQNAARVASLGDIQKGGDPAEVSKFLNTQFRAMEDNYDSEVASRAMAAQGKMAALGGEATPEVQGSAVRGALADAEAATRAKEKGLWEAVDPNGDLTGNVTATVAKAKELAGSVRPTAKPMQGEEAAIFDAAQSLPAIAPTADLIALRSRVSTEMRNELIANGRSPTYARLSILRGEIQDNLAKTISDKVEEEANNVSQKTMSPDETTAARLKGWVDDFYSSRGPNVPLQQVRESAGPATPEILPDLPRGIRPELAENSPNVSGTEVQGQSPKLRGSFQAPGEISPATMPSVRLPTEPNAPSRLLETADGGVAMPRTPSETPSGGLGGSGSKERLGPNTTWGALAGSGSDGTRFSEAGGRRGGTSDSGLPGVAPTFDEAAAARLREATVATRERAGTFGRGGVADVLRKAGTADIFRLPEASVPAKFFHLGLAAYGDIQGLYKAIGADKAVPLLADYAASSLRRAAMREDGTLDPAKFARWRSSHEGALRALPDGVRNSFNDANSASAALSKGIEAREVALKEAQSGAIGKIMNAETPEDVTKTVASILRGPNSLAAFKDVARQASKDPAAKAGLRQAVADYVSQKLISNSEEATSGVNRIKADAFQTFLKENRPHLAQIFSKGEMDNMEAISADIRQAKRSEQAVKLPGGSNTAQDTAGLKRGTFAQSMFRRIADVAGASIGATFGGLPGAFAGAIGGEALTAMREAGIKRVDDLVAQAMLHPQIMRELLKKVPANAGAKAGSGLARSIRNVAAANTLMAAARAHKNADSDSP